MNKIMRYAVIFILLTEILTIILAPNQKVAAVVVTKGIAPGNSFTYGTNNGKSWIQMDETGAPIFSTWQKYVNMSTITFQITPNPTTNPYLVNYNRTVKYQNQSTTESQASLDIDTGAGNDITFFISAGLKKNDKMYPDPASNNFTWTINDTRTDPHWGGRETCFFNHTSKGVETAGIVTYISNVIIWDSLTGVLLTVYEARASATMVSGTILPVGGTVFYQLIANNIGIPIAQSASGGDITPIIVAVIVIFVIAIIVIVVRVSTNTPKKKFKRLKK